jgi:hypothetical protein
MNEVAEKIASLNDSFRKVETMNLTRGIFEFRDTLGLIRVIRSYDRFNEDNDPHGEHDFGRLTWENQTVFWKIDYYDPSFEMWCDPLHPECERVLTVMLAEEY